MLKVVLLATEPKVDLAKSATTQGSKVFLPVVAAALVVVLASVVGPTSVEIYVDNAADLLEVVVKKGTTQVHVEVEAPAIIVTGVDEENVPVQTATTIVDATVLVTYEKIA